MSNKNVKRFLLLFALGIAYGFMYVMPYMKSPPWAAPTSSSAR